MAAPPPPKTFADTAEAKKSLLEIITVLESHEEQLKALITEAGDDQQKRMASVVPVLQKILGASLESAGFPKPPMGAMQAMMAFTQASVKPGGEVLKKGMDILKAGMMGQFPSSEVIAAVKAELA